MARSSPPTVDATRLTDLIADLVRIPSVNPMLVRGGAGEGAIAAHLADVCRRLGMTVTVEDAAPGRPNVVAVLPGSDPAGGRRLLLNGHMDTVGLAGMQAPFTPEIRAARLYGRGAFDMKASLAAMVAAVAAFRSTGRTLLGDIVLTFVSDEEHLSVGTAAIAGRVSADAAIVTEPTGLAICVAHKGFLWATIRTEGRAAHGSNYGVGVDAIARMGRVLARLELLERDVLPRRTHPLLGRPSLHASLIQGGEGLSTYPPSCELALERRTLPNETDDAVRAELQGILDSLRERDSTFQASLRVCGARPGLEADRGVGVVPALHRACVTVRGEEPAYTGAAFWTDAALLAGAGVPTVLFGPAGDGAHADVEYVDLPSAVACAQVLVNTIDEFCGSERASA
ncbi:MAG TPA: M20/M25/M40 family metallo-hydrolase [bacterium]|nr:M20/M25/M40 family metallo-hydrolase [bacterium]